MHPLVRRLAARVGPTMPKRLLAKVLAARSWVADGVAIGPPSARRVLALAPHPDDESLAFGGTLALLADGGAQVTLVFASDGDATVGSALPRQEIARIRRAEGEAAAEILGVGGVRFLGHSDGGLHEQVDALTRTIDELLDDVRPQLVLLPWFLDASDDHRAVNLALARAQPSADLDIWGGEVWTPVPANRLVDISAVVERKRAAIAAHATAHGAFDLSAMLGLNRYRSLQGRRGVGHAEAFLAAPGPVYADLVARNLELVDGRVGVRGA